MPAVRAVALFVLVGAVMACGGSTVTTSSVAPAASKSPGGGTQVEGGSIPADYKVSVVRDGATLATFTTEELAKLGGKHGGRGPGPTLAAVLRSAHADDASRSLHLQGATGDQLDVPVKNVLDNENDYEIFLTPKSTAKMDCPEGTVRHILTVTVV